MKILDVTSVKIVSKPWGYEKWLTEQPYALKEMFIRTGKRTSLQFHEMKLETIYVLSGQGVLYYSDDPMDATKYKSGGYSTIEIANIIANLKEAVLLPGVIFHIIPGYIHRIESKKDLLLIEASTPQLDDVYRLQDDLSRPHGRINSEHGSTREP